MQRVRVRVTRKQLTGRATCFGIGLLLQFDLMRPPHEDACVSEIRYPPATKGGEAFFVPRPAPAGVTAAGELLACRMSGPQSLAWDWPAGIGLPPIGNAVMLCAEDDGWLLVYVHDNTHNRSSLNIYDAFTMSPHPLARVLLPQRVPYGEWPGHTEIGTRVRPTQLW